MASKLPGMIRTAQKAFGEWSQLSGSERGRRLHRAAQLLQKRARDVALLDVKDTNVCITETLEGNVPFAVDALEFYGSLAPTALTGTHMDLPDGGLYRNSFGYCRREPIGVCGGIGAWNYPTMIVAWKAAPALACGNTMIYKPSEFSPSSAHAFAEILSDAGVPEGVFQVVEGAGDVGQAMCEAEGIVKISFTGSAEAGRKVAAACAPTLKQNTLELGGKSPFIIFEDADVQRAVDAAMQGNFCNTGQCCSNGTRVFVQESILDEFEEKLRATIAATVKIGDPFDEATTMGPVIHRGQYDKVMSFIEAAQKDPSCTFVTDEGAATYDRERLVISPTVIRSTSDDALVAREEIFGPVMTILPFRTEEEAVRRANDTIYGLAGGVMTKDISRAHRVAKQLDAGSIFVNNYNVYPIEMPFGPFKQSGYGKECGTQGIAGYTRTKSVFVESE